MKKLKLMLLAMLVVSLVGTVCHAELAAETASIGADDVYEINNMTPGSSKTFLGTRLRGVLQTGNDDSAANEFTTQSYSYTPTTTSLNKTTGSLYGESIALQNSYSNHVFQITLETDGGMPFTVSPATTTGFTSVRLDDAGDTVVLKYIDATQGWEIVGGNGYDVDGYFGKTSYAATDCPGNSPCGATTISTPVVAITTNATAALDHSISALANGKSGQEITWVLVTDGGADFVVTPATKTGFTNLTLDDANDACTIKYTDSLTGWVITGNSACTIN